MAGAARSRKCGCSRKLSCRGPRPWARGSAGANERTDDRFDFARSAFDRDEPDRAMAHFRTWAAEHNCQRRTETKITLSRQTRFVLSGGVQLRAQPSLRAAFAF